MPLTPVVRRCFCGALADPRTLHDREPTCSDHMQPDTEPDNPIARSRRSQPPKDEPPRAA